MLKAFFVGIVILLLGACGGSNTLSDTHKEVKAYLIILYSYPIGQYQQEWEKLYQLNTDKKVFVVVNVSNGPGNEKDQNFENAITTLKSKGYSVLGYINTKYGEKDLNLVKSEADRWLEFYGDKIDGFFIDEVYNTLDRYSYYEQISNYLRSKSKLIVLNPGTNIPLEYFQLADKIVVFENSADEFLRYTYNNYRAVEPERVCTIVYNLTSREEAQRIKTKSLENNSECLYLSEDNTYFKLSPYLE
ncbi:spherulation-specific family 4 protein [Thermocrinis sp.]